MYWLLFRFRLGVASLRERRSRTFFQKIAATRRFERQLRWQAGLDGELRGVGTQRTAGSQIDDPETQLILTELKLVKSALTGNETEHSVPESREFYWSKIKSAIDRESEKKTRRHADLGWRLAPVCGLFLAICALLLLKPETETVSPRLPTEVEVASEDVGTVTYQDSQAGLTVVWHYDRGDDESDSALPEMAEDL